MKVSTEFNLKDSEKHKLDTALWILISERLKALRIEKGRSLIELKNYLNHKSVTTLVRFEKKSGRLNINDIYLLCGLYTTPISEVMPTFEEVLNTAKVEIPFEKEIIERKEISLSISRVKSGEKKIRDIIDRLESSKRNKS